MCAVEGCEDGGGAAGKGNRKDGANPVRAALLRRAIKCIA